MKLTRRQEAFIRKLLDVYREAQEPVHYSLLAERLGVSRFTAYDMLRLLEEKGFVSSDYQLSARKSGPGRSEVVFLPTPLAHQLIAEMGGASREDWETVKQRVVDEVKSGQVRDREVVQEMLARVPPEGQDPRRYCVEVMKVVALRLRGHSGGQVLLDYLPRLLPNKNADCRADLSLLGGFALGILASETKGDPAWSRELFDHVKRYQALVAEMDPQLCRKLARSLRQVFASLKQGSES
jgi:hypothetical protein